jgi:hypothetical protein
MQLRRFMGTLRSALLLNRRGTRRARVAGASCEYVDRVEQIFGFRRRSSLKLDR